MTVILPTEATSLSSSRARIASAVGRKTISRRFFGRFRSYSLHGQQRSAYLVEAMVKGDRRRGQDEKEKEKDVNERGTGRERERERGGGLYGRGARLKFLHTNEWQPKNQTKEEHAGGKNQERKEGRKISLMPRRFARGTDECPAIDDRQI